VSSSNGVEGDHGGDVAWKVTGEHSEEHADPREGEKNAEKERKRPRDAASPISPLKIGGGV